MQEFADLLAESGNAPGLEVREEQVENRRYVRRFSIYEERGLGISPNRGCDENRNDEKRKSRTTEREKAGRRFRRLLPRVSAEFSVVGRNARHEWRGNEDGEIANRRILATARKALNDISEIARGDIPCRTVHLASMVSRGSVSERDVSV